MDHLEQQKTRQLNLLVFINTSTSILYLFIYLFLFNLNIPSLMYFIFVILYSSTLIFSVKRKIHQGIYWIVTIYLIQIFLFANLMFERDTGYHFFYFVMPTIIILLLKKQEVLIKVFYSFLALALFFAAELYHDRPSFVIVLNEHQSHILYEISLFLCFSGFIFITLNYYIDILKVESELSRQAGLDPLTGIANRRLFYTHFENIYNSNRRYKTEMSLLMIDVDHFKKINDNHGHQVGDEALIWMTNEIKDCIRDSDIFARYGGEEFCLLLPVTGEEKAAITAEKIRKKIEDSSMQSSSGIQIKMTISCGISSILGSEADENYDTLVQNADKALYEAKETGRNKCVVYSASKSL